MTRSGPASDRERVLVLECRLEQMRAALDAARREADSARARLAEAAAREAGHARRFTLIHEELADARAEIAALHRHLERSESLREELSGHLFEGGRREDALELVRLRRKVLAEDQRAVFADRTVDRLRARVEELVSSREMLLTRIAEWQQLIRKGEPEAADLSEFLAELRREILDLEHRSMSSDAREAHLRERLLDAGLDPEDDAAATAEAKEPLRVREVGARSPRPVAPPAVADADAAQTGPDLFDRVTVEAEAGAEGNAATGSEADVGKAAETGEVAASASGPSSTAADHPAEGEGATDPVAVAAHPVASQPDAPPSRRDAAYARHGFAVGRIDGLIDELDAARQPALQSDVLLRLGRSGDVGAVDTVRSYTDSVEPAVRAAAYEALGRLLDRSPEALLPYVRDGLADGDPRVRRRVVLATASARGLGTQGLLDPLREDPDPQVRRVVRQVLRQVRARGAPGDRETRTPPGAMEPDSLGTRSSRPLATRPSRTVS